MSINQKAITTAIAFALAISSGLAYSSDKIIEILKAALENNKNAPKIESIRETSIPGLYEAATKNQLAYVSKDGKYVLFGSLVELETGKNLTLERMAEILRIDFKIFVLADAIVIKKGVGKYKFASFMDPDCPNCRNLQASLDATKDANYTQYVFLMPLDVHPNAMEKSESIWCAKDRATAWTAALEGKRVEKKSCPNPLSRNAALAERIGVLGTPMSYGEDGNVLSPETILMNVGSK